MRIAAIIANYNMPERADALADSIKAYVRWPCDVYLVDNGSDLVPPARNTTVTVKPNCQTTGGWIAGLKAAKIASDASPNYSYFGYWFLITSAEYSGTEDILTPMAELLVGDGDAVGVHPALTPDSTTSWKHLITRGGSGPRRTWMIDNIASLYRASWFDSIDWFDERLIYGWGIDLETCYLARRSGWSLWIHEDVKIKKVTDIGYTMKRMNMGASERQVLATNNMHSVMREKYGSNWWNKVTTEHIDAEWL